MQELSRYYLWSAAIFTPKIMLFQVGLWNLYQHAFGMFGIQRVDSSTEKSWKVINMVLDSSGQIYSYLITIYDGY